VIGGFNAEQEVENTEVTDKLLKRLLQDLPVKAAAQLAAELTGLKKNELYQTRAIIERSISEKNFSITFLFNYCNVIMHVAVH